MEQQGIFKGLLLIPVAALVVVVMMRLLVGVRTSGTFMPILIALAFIQTTLLVGLIIFLRCAIGSGPVDPLLSESAQFTAGGAGGDGNYCGDSADGGTGGGTSYKLGLDQVLTVTFFPTVIVAWTIERMSILWEEEGGHEVLIQGQRQFGGRGAGLYGNVQSVWLHT